MAEKSKKQILAELATSIFDEELDRFIKLRSSQSTPPLRRPGEYPLEKAATFRANVLQAQFNLLSRLAKVASDDDVDDTPQRRHQAKVDEFIQQGRLDPEKLERFRTEMAERLIDEE